MKSRVSFGKLSFREIERKANRRLGKDPNEGKMKVADWLVMLVLFLLIKVDIIPESVPYGEWLGLSLAIVVLFVLFFFKFRRQAPRTCWRNTSWATAMWATITTIVPLALYWLDEITDVEVLCMALTLSAVLWLACLGSLLRLRYIRRRSRQEIAMMRLREKRRRNLECL